MTRRRRYIDPIIILCITAGVIIIGTFAWATWLGLSTGHWPEIRLLP
jgi:hypothetical protein